MPASNFSFVKNDVLRQNLDEALDHVVTLLPFSESDTYNDTARSAFRKTIIIYTASIVEALLFYILDNKFNADDISEHYATWKLKDETILHKIDDKHKIVAGHYQKFDGDGNKTKLNLGQISDFLKSKKVISPAMYTKIDIVRKLRNDQHIGSHTVVKSYTEKDLEEAFSVASVIKTFAKDNT